MTHPPCGRPLLFVGAAVAVIALFLGLVAGPASAVPDVGARVPPGKSGEPGPKPQKAGEAKKKTSQRAKSESARPGKNAEKGPHAGKGPPGHHGGNTDKTKVKSASEDKDQDKDTGDLELSRSGFQDQDETASVPTPDATTTVPLRNPDREIRTLSNGAPSIPTSLTHPPVDPAPAAEDVTDAPPPADAVIGGALGPPLLGAGPTPSQWAPFVPALDEPAFPAILLAALAVFLALFGRGDRRDPKLVEAVVDDQAQDVDFS